VDDHVGLVRHRDRRHSAVDLHGLRAGHRLHNDRDHDDGSALDQAAVLEVTNRTFQQRLTERVVHRSLPFFLILISNDKD